MRCKIHKRQAERGVVLTVALIVTAVIGLTLFSYLQLVQNQNLTVARSQAWNDSLAIAEAGAEEAMAQLNPGATAVVNLAANGWGPAVNGLYGPITRTLAAGTYAVSYTSSNTTVIIYSAGSVTEPFMGTTVTRTVKVMTASNPVFNVAFAAVGGITMNGSGVAADSFDSSNPALSTNGQYNSAMTSTNGNVASLVGPVNLGNHTIDGSLYLGATAQFQSSSNQVNGTVFNDFNVTFPTVVLPPVAWLPAPAVSQTIGGTTYSHVFLLGGDYNVTDSGSIYVGTNVSVTLYITNSSFNPGALTIAGSWTNSGSVIAYVASPSATVGGNTTVNSGLASDFIFYGLPSLTSLTFSGNSSVVAAIYAPNAALTLNGGGNNNGVIGSVVAASITMNGHYDFHYDQSLANAAAKAYSMVSWQEL